LNLLVKKVEEIQKMETMNSSRSTSLTGAVSDKDTEKLQYRLNILKNVKDEDNSRKFQIFHSIPKSNVQGGIAVLGEMFEALPTQNP